MAPLTTRAGAYTPDDPIARISAAQANRPYRHHGPRPVAQHDILTAKNLYMRHRLSAADMRNDVAALEAALAEDHLHGGMTPSGIRDVQRQIARLNNRIAHSQAQNALIRSGLGDLDRKAVERAHIPGFPKQ